MNPTLIETPKGERLVILPEADYKALVAAAEGRVAAASEVVVPAEVANRIFAGEHPVRVYREWRGLTAADLAGTAGVSAGHLSDVERGRRQASVEIRARLAAALGVHADDLLPANME